MGVLPLQFNQHTRSQARTIPYSKQYHNIHNTCIEYSTQNDTCSQQDNDVESTTYKDWFKHVNWYSKLICAHFWGTCILSKISHKIHTLKCAPLNSKCVWLRPDPLRGSALQTLAEMGRGMEGIRKMMDKGGRERGRRGTARICKAWTKALTHHCLTTSRSWCQAAIGRRGLASIFRQWCVGEPGSIFAPSSTKPITFLLRLTPPGTITASLSVTFCKRHRGNINSADVFRQNGSTLQYTR